MRHRATAAIKQIPSWQREHWLLFACVLAATMLVIAIVPGFAVAMRDDGPQARESIPLELPPLLADDVDTDSLDPGSLATDLYVGSSRERWVTAEVRPGQTLGELFESQGLSSRDLYQLLQHEPTRDALVKIHPGDQFAFLTPEPGKLESMQFDVDAATRVVLTLDGDKVKERRIQRELERRVKVAGGVIESSLFGAANGAGMSNAMTLELAKVFGYDIDFAQDLRIGDRFYVVYDEVYRDGERISSGNILAAAFVNQGREFSAYRYVFADGRDAYFDHEGRPMKKSFLRMPIEFARLSSRFSSARKHPVLGKVRAHKGVDYAARTGTPIMSAGDGRVSHAGWINGYGRTIIVDHGRGYTTLYGHMSKLGKYRTGSRVRQGDVIGYVGMTGLASGPHLHYEFRVKGVHQNPLTVTMPKPEPLPKSELARFNLQNSPMMAQLALLSADQPLALLKR
ncbi:MAG: peptidoglycan DD-metalloendopeptidase family protein [Lysobacteraceae bacterium]